MTNFTYDELNRLTEAVYPTNQAVGHRRVTYGYNDSGDRTELKTWTGSPGSWTQYGSTVTYSYDAAGRLTAAAGLNYCSDNNGNQTRRTASACPAGGDSFSYNFENRLTQAVIGGTATTYTSNGDGVRVKKVTGGATAEYFQDVAGGLPRVSADVAGSVWTFYVYGNGVIGKVGTDGAPRYYHTDGNGNVRAMTDSTGAVVERYDYDAFGSLRNTPAGVSNDRRYTGEQHDAESGYTFLRARYYDPAIGRFTSRDRLESGNWFAYANNNPISFGDPSGLSAANCIDPVAGCQRSGVQMPGPICGSTCQGNPAPDACLEI